jgi:hypothetical protein
MLHQRLKLVPVAGLGQKIQSFSNHTTQPLPTNYTERTASLLTNANRISHFPHLSRVCQKAFNTHLLLTNYSLKIHLLALSLALF